MCVAKAMEITSREKCWTEHKLRPSEHKTRYVRWMCACVRTTVLSPLSPKWLCRFRSHTPLISLFEEWLINGHDSSLFFTDVQMSHSSMCTDNALANTHTHASTHCAAIAAAAAEGEQTWPAEGIHQTDVSWTLEHFFHLFPLQFYIRGSPCHSPSLSTFLPFITCLTTWWQIHEARVQDKEWFISHKYGVVCKLVKTKCGKCYVNVQMSVVKLLPFE